MQCPRVLATSKTGSAERSHYRLKHAPSPELCRSASDLKRSHRTPFKNFKFQQFIIHKRQAIIDVVSISAPFYLFCYITFSLTKHNKERTYSYTHARHAHWSPFFPRMQTNIGTIVYSAAVPPLWNSLPISVWRAGNVITPLMSTLPLLNGKYRFSPLFPRSPFWAKCNGFRNKKSWKTSSIYCTQTRMAHQEGDLYKITR